MFYSTKRTDRYGWTNGRSGGLNLIIEKLCFKKMVAYLESLYEFKLAVNCRGRCQGGARSAFGNFVPHLMIFDASLKQKSRRMKMM